MIDILKELKGIHTKLLVLNRDITYEGRVCSAELTDRLRKGLKGAAAIEHYNLWMREAGLRHLMVR